MNEQAFVLEQLSKREMSRAELQFTPQSVLDDMVKSGVITERQVVKPSKANPARMMTYVYYSKGA